jgi:DNA-binding LytR/AlgR family response regulator
MEIKCLIIDDEPPAQRILEKYIADIGTLKLEGKCNNAFEAMEMLHSKQIDLMFLDINMPKMTGLSFLQTLKNPPLVIITTAYREYAMEGFELDVLDYLKKPISFERFVKAVNKAVDRLQPTQNTAPAFVINENSRQQLDEAFIFVKDDKITYRVDLKDIFYIEAVGDYAKIITSKKVYVTCQSMKKFESVLPSNRFIRVHKSYIIAVSKINSMEGNILNINNVQIPIGATFRKTFFDLVDSLNSSLM